MESPFVVGDKVAVTGCATGINTTSAMLQQSQDQK